MDYQRSLLTFVDILGFSQLITTEDATTIHALLEELQRSVAVDPGIASMYEMEVLTFSDCTVRSVHVDSARNIENQDGILYHELNDLACAQAAVMCHGYLLRGGMTIGNALIDDRIVFGPALVMAHHIESKVASSPRIVIDESVLKAFEAEPLLRDKGYGVAEQRGELFKKIRKDEDGLFFVDYLMGSMDWESYDNADKFAIHRELILSEAHNNKDNPKILPKYLWMARYHSIVVEELGADWFRDILEQDIEDLRIAPGELPPPIEKAG